MAVTGTAFGMIFVWNRSIIVEGTGEQNEKRLIKVVTLNGTREPINILTTVHDTYLVCGGGSGTIQFFDFDFKIMAWFDDVGLSGVKSISFSSKEKVTVKPPELGADAKEKNDCLF